MATDTIFSKIIRGEVPSHKVYEDAHVFAFLDIAPLSYGHTLLIPKEPATTLDALSSESAAALGRALPALCRAVQAASGVRDYNVLQNNGSLAHQAVAHVHFHIIPKPDGERGLGVQWSTSQMQADEARALCERMQEALRRDPVAV